MTHMRSTALASPHDHRSSRSSSSSSSSSNSDHRCFVTCMDDACERCLSACLTCGCLKTLRRRAQQVFAGVSCLQFASICTRCSLSHVRCPCVHNPPPSPPPPSSIPQWRMHLSPPLFLRSCPRLNRVPVHPPIHCIYCNHHRHHHRRRRHHHHRRNHGHPTSSLHHSHSSLPLPPLGSPHLRGILLHVSRVHNEKLRRFAPNLPCIASPPPPPLHVPAVVWTIAAAAHR